jgi:hypothetical protein
MNVRFEAEGHKYFIDDRPAPGVSEILDSAGFVSPFCKNELAADRGTSGHEWFAIVMRGEIDEYEVPESALWVVKAAEAFRNDLQVVPLNSRCGGETTDRPVPVIEMCYGSKLGFAGTPDLVDNQFRLWDAKFWSSASPSSIKSARVQTAGYKRLVEENECIRIKARNVVHFHQSYQSGYRAIPLRDKIDESIFISALNCYKWVNS